MKTSCLRLKLVELNFLVSFNTDDQSKTNITNTVYIITQNYLVQFLKCLADIFDNLTFQDASKVAIFIPPSSYILHYHGKCGLFTIYLKGNDMKNSKFGKS